MLEAFLVSWRIERPFGDTTHSCTTPALSRYVQNGMGLVLSGQLVADMGGEESRANRGSRHSECAVLALQLPI